MQSQLPPGWQQLSTPEGRPYYYNPATKETTWSPPTGAAAPAAAPAPAPRPAPAPQPAGDHRYTLASLVAATGQKDRGQGHFELEKPELLEINLGGQTPWAWIKNGSMIARRGSVKFTRQGMAEQGFKKLAMKKMTGEGVKLVKAEGQGKVFCADAGKKIIIVNLNNERLFINGNDILAMSSTLKYDIKMMKGASMTTGLFNVQVTGTGMVAFGCHGTPCTLSATPGNPVYTDPDATVAWTHQAELKADVSMKAMIGRTTGEEFQMYFKEGHVVVQPYEEVVFKTGGGGGGGGGAASAFGEVLGALG